MPDHEVKHSIIPSHHTADFREHGIFAALESLTDLNSSTLPLEKIANQVAVHTRAELNANCVALWLVDDLHKFILLQAFSCVNSTETNPKKFNISLDEPSPVADCLKEVKPSIHKKLTLAEIDPRAATLTKKYVSGVLPLLTFAGAIGVLEILTAADDPLNSAELEALQVLASQIALLLSNHKNADRLSHQTGLQKKLYEITAKIDQAKDYQSIVQITVEELCTALNLPGATMNVNIANVGAKSVSNVEKNQ